jgi:hypothetical protein
MRLAAVAAPFAAHAWVEVDGRVLDPAFVVFPQGPLEHPAGERAPA